MLRGDNKMIKIESRPCCIENNKYFLLYTVYTTVCTFCFVQCTRPCGGGEQFRNAICVDENGNIVPDKVCHNERKLYGQLCNTEECPRWVEGGWSGVSSNSLDQLKVIDLS